MTNVLANLTPSTDPSGLVAELAREDAEQVRRRARVATIEVGQELWDQGDPAVACLVVAEGTAEVRRHGRRAGRVEPGALAGVTALLARHPHRTSVRAATPMTVWWLDGDAVEQLVVEAPTFARALVRRLARAAVATNF